MRIRAFLRSIRSGQRSRVTAAKPQATDVSHDGITAVTACKVCKGLQGKSLLIDCSWDDLQATSEAGCGGCNLLRIVIMSHEPALQRCQVSNMWFKPHDFILHVKNRYPYWPAGDSLIVEIVNAEDGETPSPWTSLQRLRPKLGLEHPAMAGRQISQWLETCKIHQECQDSLLHERSYLPTRVLEIQGPENVRLHITDEGEIGRYACLSHCWGGVVPLRTTSDNLESFQSTGIPWQSLPRTFQHAIDIAHRLGVAYLWIDSLCIVQDSLLDWRHEGSRMSAIYSGAYFTISASDASSSSVGLYHDMTEHKHRDGTHSHVLPHPTRSGASYKVVSHERYSLRSSRFHENALPLQQRAWAFQERILSPRIVHFADDMLYWECLSTCASEIGMPEGDPETPRNFRSLMLRAIKTDPLNQDLGHKISRWHEIVSHFTSCKLTFPNDKLPALQGVARAVQHERNCAYFAGLWEDSLWCDALWYVSEPKEATIPTYRAPSWSWASREGVVHYLPVESLKQKATIICVTTNPAGDDPMGELIGGTLTIRGPCLPASIERRSSDVTQLIVRNHVGDKISLGWHGDKQYQAMEDRQVTLLGLASSHGGLETHMLVLAQVNDNTTLFERIGQARLNHRNWINGPNWEEREFTIV